MRPMWTRGPECPLSSLAMGRKKEHQVEDEVPEEQEEQPAEEVVLETPPEEVLSSNADIDRYLRNAQRKR